MRGRSATHAEITDHIKVRTLRLPEIGAWLERYAR